MAGLSQFFRDLGTPKTVIWHPPRQLGSKESITRHSRGILNGGRRALNQRFAIGIAEEASPEGSYRGEIEEAKMAWSDGIDTEWTNRTKLPPKGEKDKLRRFRGTRDWLKKDLEVAKA